MSDQDDLDVAKSLEDAAWEELDNQHLNGDRGLYADTLSGVVEGEIDMPALILAILRAYWDEVGR